MSNCRVKIGAERIGGPGANSHAGASVSGESRGKPNGFADDSAAGTNPLVRDDSYNDKNTSAHENVEDCDIRITKASANSTHGEREENCDSVFNSDFASCNKRGTNDTNVGTKKRKPRPSRRAIDIQESPLEEGYSCAEIFRYDLSHDHLSPGKYSIVSMRNEVSNTNEEASSSFKTPSSDKSSEETSDEEQVVSKGLERFCLERDFQILNSGEPSLEEHVVRSKISARVDAQKGYVRVRSRVNLPTLSLFQPHQEDCSPGHNPAYIKDGSIQGLELQILNTTSVTGPAARKVLSISELLDSSSLDHRSTQDLSNCAATLQSQRGHRGDGKVGAQRRKDDLDSLSGLCADRTAQWKQFTRANAVVHPSKVSNHERFSQTVTDRHFVVEPKCDSGALFARTANPRVDLLCPACSKTCVSNSYLILHVRSHTDEKPFACAECDKKFSHSGNLTLHMGYHTGEKPFACVNCDKRFSQRGKLTIHIKSRTGAKGIRSHRSSGMSAD